MFFSSDIHRVHELVRGTVGVRRKVAGSKREFGSSFKLSITIVTLFSVPNVLIVPLIDGFMLVIQDHPLIFEI